MFSKLLAKMSLIERFTVAFIVALVLFIATHFLILRQVYHAELHRQASSIADKVEVFGRWVAKYGGVWVVNDADPASAYLSEVDLAHPEKGSLKFRSKNPALATREFSEVVQNSPTQAKFRMTSDNWMSKNNMPDLFEAQAIINFKKSKDINEYVEISGGQYRYARKIIHTKNCLKCHDSPATAPPEVAARYGTSHGYGFKEGDVAGALSVTIPAEPLLKTTVQFIGPLEICGLLLAFAILYVYVHFGIVKPIRRTTDITVDMSIGKDADFELPVSSADEARGELTKLQIAIRRFRTSMMMAIGKMRKEKTTPKDDREK